MGRKEKPAEKPRRGHPWKNTPGSKPRTFRITDGEYAALARYLKELRRKPGPK